MLLHPQSLTVLPTNRRLQSPLNWSSHSKFTSDTPFLLIWPSRPLPTLKFNDQQLSPFPACLWLSRMVNGWCLALFLTLRLNPNSEKLSDLLVTPEQQGNSPFNSLLAIKCFLLASLPHATWKRYCALKWNTSGLHEWIWMRPPTTLSSVTELRLPSYVTTPSLRPISSSIYIVALVSSKKWHPHDLWKLL